MHRSQTHSVVVLVVIVLPILALVHKNRTLRGLLLLGATGLTIRRVGLVWKLHASILALAQ